MSSRSFILEGTWLTLASYVTFYKPVCDVIWTGCCLRHSTDREVALMMLMAYLSYMLAEVRIRETLDHFRVSFIWKNQFNTVYFIWVAAIRLERYPHSIFLWYCDVPLHLAQRNRELKSNYQVNTISIFCLKSFSIISSYSVHLLWYRHTFATLSFLAETFIFLYVGMDALDIEKWRFVSDRWTENK